MALSQIPGHTDQAIYSIRVENRGDVNRKARQQHRCRRFAAAVDACFFIRASAQPENRDGFRLRIDDPVFWHAAFGVVSALLYQVSFRLLFTDDFQGEVGAKPETVLPARIGGREKQQEVGLPELFWPNSKS